MALSKILKIKNSIIVANGLLPSIFSQSWFEKNGIFKDSEFLPDCVFSRDFVQIRTTSKVRIVIFQNQIQFVSDDDIETAINNTLIPIVSSLGSFAFAAAGINYFWYLTDPELTLAELSKKYFKSEQLKVTSLFSDNSAQYGAYLSKDIFGCRLKLDIKPVKALDLGLNETTEGISFAFNFHKDFTPDTLNQDELKTFLSKCPQLYSESERVMNLY